MKSWIKLFFTASITALLWIIMPGKLSAAAVPPALSKANTRPQLILNLSPTSMAS